MNNVVKMTATGPEIVARGRDLIKLMLRVFDAENGIGQQAIVAEIDAITASLPALRQQIEFALRPAGEKEIAAHLALLLKAFPNVGKDDGAAFGRLLLEDVISQKPSVGALEAGCAQMRRTSKFLPSIAEVLEAVASSQASLNSAKERIDELPEARRRIEGLISERRMLAQLKTNRRDGGESA